MAKAKAKSEVKRGGGSIAEQTAKLETLVGAKGVAQADAWIADPALHDVIRLAFKKLPKASTRALVLSKRELVTYDQIKTAAGAKAADSWKASILEAKQAAKK